RLSRSAHGYAEPFCITMDWVSNPSDLNVTDISPGIQQVQYPEPDNMISSSQFLEEQIQIISSQLLTENQQNKYLEEQIQ
ncbi:11925_t:CDS:2, partial [Racocetra persica]